MFEDVLLPLHPVALPRSLQPEDKSQDLFGIHEMFTPPPLPQVPGWQGGLSADVLKVLGHYGDPPSNRREPDLPIDPSQIPVPGADRLLPDNRPAPSLLPPDKLQFYPSGGVAPRAVDNEPVCMGGVELPNAKMSVGKEEPPWLTTSADILPDEPAKQNFIPTGPIDALGWASGKDAVKRSDTLRGSARLAGINADSTVSRHRNADNEVVGVSANGKIGMPSWARYLGGPLAGGLMDLWAATDEGPSYNYGSGSFLDPEGKQTYGVQGGVSSRKISAEQSFSLSNDPTQKGGPEWYIGGDLSGPDASAAMTANDSTLQIGSQANTGSGSVTLGTRGTGNQDRSFRFGLSEGGGGAGRLHYGDADHDGRREYGFGFDYGPVAMDYKTEDPVGDLFRAATAGSPMLYAANLIAGGKSTDGRTLTEAAGVNETVSQLGALGQEWAGAGRQLVRNAFKQSEDDPSSVYAGMY